MLKGIDVDKLDWAQLGTDASTLRDEIAAKKRAAKAAGNDGMNWSSDAKANGSSAVTVKQSITPFWDTRIGADMTVTREPTTMSELMAQKAANAADSEINVIPITISTLGEGLACVSITEIVYPAAADTPGVPCRETPGVVPY